LLLIAQTLKAQRWDMKGEEVAGLIVDGRPLTEGMKRDIDEKTRASTGEGAGRALTGVKVPINRKLSLSSLRPRLWQVAIVDAQ